MRSLTLHLRFLIAILVVLGLSITGYQIFVLKTPVTENEIDNLWTIDAKIEFEVRGSKPVKVDLLIPPKSGDYNITNELFLAERYGQNVDDSQNGRIVTWSARKISGHQTLYYRFNLTKRYSDDIVSPEKGVTWREPIALDGVKKLATESLISDIRQKSSNTETFITTTINVVNDIKNDNVKLLLGNDKSIENKANVIELLLSQAYIPIERAHTLRLVNSSNQSPELWIRSFIETKRKSDKNEKSDGGSSNAKGNWYYFNPLNGNIGLPDDRIVWWVGEDPALSVENGYQDHINFSIEKSELTALSLAKLSQEGGNFMEYSFYSLPISTQMAYQIMLMIPFGVLVILILRNIVGLNTLGTFTPVLIALAFRETGLTFGIIFFTLIVSIGLSLRSYLEHLKLQMLPRLSVVLTLVVLLIIFAGLFSHKLGFEQGLSITLFPMVILTMTIERLSITWEERGAAFALKVAVGTLITASIAYLVMGIHGLSYFVFTFPAILLVLIAFMLAMGRYRGYRLMELVRFKAMVK